VQDITERRRAEQARQRLATAVEQAGESIVITDTDGVIKYVNPAFERITGYARAEVLGQTPRMLKSGQHEPPYYREIWQRIRAGLVWSGRFVNRKKDGTTYQEEATISPVRDISGRIVNYVSAARDVTQEVELQQQLYQSQKMEAIGTLAGGVAHDFNNILTGIMGHAELLKIEGGLNERAVAAAETIEKASHRAAELTRKLLGFARRGKHQNVPVDVHGTIQEVIGLLGPTLDKNIEIQCHFSDDRVFVLGDPGQVQQVLLNLAVNARDAMPHGGVLSFSTSVVELDEEDTRKYNNVSPGRYLMIAVADTGTGIPDDVRGRIFEPFFTTKERGKGTGMGLAMVYGIVRNHGGVIKVDTELGKGTIFSVYLTVAEGVETAETATRPEGLISGSGRVLVVDDEEIVREVAAGYLKHLGYTVETAVDGQAAVEYYAQHWREIDLVIIDMVMPKLGGRDCFRELLKINKDVRAVLSTGYGFNVAAQEILDEGVAGFIQKPYELIQISEVVATAMRK
jgi:PAS domain S-box-containing protein